MAITLTAKSPPPWTEGGNHGRVVLRAALGAECDRRKSCSSLGSEPRDCARRALLTCYSLCARSPLCAGDPLGPLGSRHTLRTGLNPAGPWTPWRLEHPGLRRRLARLGTLRPLGALRTLGTLWALGTRDVPGDAGAPLAQFLTVG